MTLLPPDLQDLSWSKVRALASETAQVNTPADVITCAERCLGTSDGKQRMFGVFLLGFTAGAEPRNLERLRKLAVPDPDWEVQEAVAQAFDYYCAAVGYEAALPQIDSWLADEHPNARRAVSEGLRPWTSKRRPYFAHSPQEAIRRLAALRSDPSDYVRHSAGNALRDIWRAHPALVDAETATWDLTNAHQHYTYLRVLKAR